MAAILTAIGPDRPGLTGALADAIVEAGGNWLESHFVRLGDQYVGSVLVELPESGLARLRAVAGAMGGDGLAVSVVEAGQGAAPQGRKLRFELVGEDRPGIVREVATALAAMQVNIEELETATEDAAMFGGRLFRAKARVMIPPGTSPDTVRARLERLSGEIIVDLED